MKEIDEKFFTKTDEYSKTKAESFLAKGEKILWRGIPKKSCYIIQNSKSGIPTFFALIWAFIDFSVLAIIFSTLNEGKEVLFFIIPFFALHLTPFWIWLGGIIKAKKEVLKREYIITNKRIFELNGTPRYMVFSLVFDEIVGVNYKQTFVDKLFHVADIYISGKENKYVLFDIPNGLFIYEKLQEIINNVYSEKFKRKVFYKDNVECKHCGSYYDSSLSRCPNCGAPKILDEE